MIIFKIYEYEQVDDFPLELNDDDDREMGYLEFEDDEENSEEITEANRDENRYENTDDIDRDENRDDRDRDENRYENRDDNLDENTDDRDEETEANRKDHATPDATLRENLKNQELEIRQKKIEFEITRQKAKENEIQQKKTKQFKKKIEAIIEHLDTEFTFKELNSFERSIVHEAADRHKLFHKTVADKVIISRNSINDITLLTYQMDKVVIEEKRYNLRNRKKK